MTLVCFGSVLTYQPGTTTCDRCTAASACAAEVGRRLQGRGESLYRVAAVPALAPKEDSRVVTDESAASRKTRAELRRLTEAGLTLEGMRADLTTGGNPLWAKRTPTYLFEAFEQMKNGVLDLHALRDGYKARVSAGTARSQIAVVNGILEVLNIGVRYGRTWRLK